MSATRPPVWLALAGDEIVAPASTTTFPIPPLGAAGGVNAAVGPTVPAATGSAEKRNW